MNGRIGFRIGGFAAVAACALLVACGGGGGGGGVTPSTGGSNSWATPTPTPTPVPTGVVTPGAVPAGTGAPLVNATPAGARGWSPYQVATTLKFPVQSGYNGSGQTIAIVGDNPPVQTDLQAFSTAYRLGFNVATQYKLVNATGSGTGGDPTDTGGQGEATLDVETVMALAPGATIEFYVLPDLTNTSFQAAENYSLTDPANPKVFSESFGGCEYSGEKVDDAIFKQGAAQGIAYFASSGDEGDACYFDATHNYYGANTPASDPYVIGVGGNENANAALTGLGSLTSTKVWNDTFLSGPGASGGGVSTVFLTPSSAQANFPGVLSGARNVPDISMPSEGVAIYQASGGGTGWQIYGGTSWSAPEAAALMAEIYQFCPAVVGTTAPASLFYTAASRGYATNFIDVTSGNNAFPGIATASPAPPVGQAWSAATGYDRASGLGLPLGVPILSYMCPNHAPQFRAAPMAMTRESLAPARDTDLANAIDTRSMQVLGVRQADQPATVALVLRNTTNIASDEQAVVSALRAAGFTIAHTAQNHQLIVASGPASTVNGYFHTQLVNVYGGRDGVRYVNAASMTLPAAIAPYVRAATADNLTRHRMSYRIR